MRTFLLSAAVALATACTPVYAATFAAENNAGGHIVLTDEKCPIPELAEVDGLAGFAYDGAGQLRPHCWVLDGDAVLVLWLDTGELTAYPARVFTEVNSETSPARRGVSVEGI